MVVVAIAALIGTMKIVFKQRSRSPGRVEEFESVSETEPGALPDSKLSGLNGIEFSSDSIFNLKKKRDASDDSLWNATGSSDEPLAPPPSHFSDPALPSLDAFE